MGEVRGAGSRGSVGGQPARRHCGATTLEDEPTRRPLGEISIEQGFISDEQLEAALEVQRQNGGRIGEILVEQGSLTRLDLASALAEQWSSLQKLRPPGPVADPQQWQDGSPALAQELTPEARAAVADLDERLRAVEQDAGAEPWQEDLNRLTSELRAAVSAVEERLEAAGSSGAESAGVVAALEAFNGRIDALEGASVSGELDALRQQVEALHTRPASVEGFGDLRDAVERLENRPDGAADISRLAGEIAALDQRLEELAGTRELTRLETRLDEVAARLQSEDAIEDLRRSLAEVATQAANGGRPDDGRVCGARRQNRPAYG